MGVSFFLQGIVIGFSIAAPVGPIGVLCIRRTLAEGRLAGLVSGLWAASADAVYGLIAAFGLTFVSSFLVSGRVWLRLIGGIFLCYLGFKTFLTKPAQSATKAKSYGLFGAYASTFFLTLTNPLTILSFATIFAGLDIASKDDSYVAAGVLVFGVFLGSALWWLLLCSGINWFRTSFNLSGLKWVNRIAGVIITAFGLVVIFNYW